ncbi:hypothetical protein F1737_00740 [Methanoplanus sp. FWC-SCC4]|uniref:Uncharacterized protein n=1 Tax=Methanochimaera problematica TaxID=2609417 RepID=A0AA97FC30_9EURY|nr:hypothetical protein [Methanoplanus sp. FWC-SCC4]WOF15308.1 hypothetical protein F1737_00740 [Methanoplanus sp. FWC-SCC4]
MTKINYIFAVFFMIAALIFTPVFAGDITFQTPYSSYTFQTGEEAKIPVIVNNGVGKDIRGTLIGKFTATGDGENPQKSSYTKQQAFNLYSDMKEFNYIIGTENEPKTIYTDIIFEFTTDRTYQVNLQGIRIIFTNEPVEEKSEGEEVSATQDDTDIDLSKLMEQKNNQVPVDKNSGQAADPAPTINQANYDTQALKESVEAENKKIKEIKKSLTSKIVADELFLKVNSSLVSQNFKDGIISVMPVNEDSGIFSLEYRSKNADIVMVSGEMQNRKISYIRQETNFSVLLPPVLLQNQTFKDHTEFLSEKNYERFFSAINTTPVGSELDLSYENGWKPARINAVIQKDNLTVITLIRESGIPFYVIPIIIILAAGGIAAAAYYGLMRHSGDEYESTTSDVPDNFVSPEDILNSAVEMFNSGHKKEACQKATQSLRMFISKKYGSGDEITDGLCLKMTREYPELNERCRDVFLKTCPVRFAGQLAETIRPEDFKEIEDSVREIIGDIK